MYGFNDIKLNAFSQIRKKKNTKTLTFKNITIICYFIS